MRIAWRDTKRILLEAVTLRTTSFDLEFHDGEGFTRTALGRTLEDESASVEERILAAMGLSSRERLAQGRKIEMPCLDLGAAQIVLFPGETFVGYQLMAQRLRPDSFVMCIGYGECWPGYVPTRAAFQDGFGHSWRWVAPGAEVRMREALERVLIPTAEE